MSEVEPWGFDAFARVRGAGMLRLAWLVTRNSEDARDAVQDALLGLFRRWPRLPAGPALDAYVRRSVINASLAVISRRPATSAASELDLLPARDGDPAELVAAADSAWRLCGVLPPVQRAAVVLRFYADLSYADIADALGCAEGTARSHVHRALAQLRTRLEVGHET